MTSRINHATTTPLLQSPTGSKDYDSTHSYLSNSSEKSPQTKKFISSSPLEKLAAVFGYCSLGCWPEKSAASEENKTYNEKSPVEYTAQSMSVLKRPIINTSYPLPDEIKEQMQACEDSIKKIIYDIESDPDKIFSSITKVLDSTANVGADISYEFNLEKLKENCRIAVAAIMQKKDIQNIKLNIENLQPSIYRIDELRLVDLLRNIFENNKNLSHIDLSLKYNNLLPQDLADLRCILSGKKLYSLNLSGNIRNIEILDDGLKEICEYFGQVEISQLHLNDWEARGDPAKSGLELLAKKLPNAKNLRELSLKNLFIRINEVGVLIPPIPTESVLLNTSIETLDLRGNFLWSDVGEVERRVAEINEEIERRNKERNETRKPINVILN